MNSVIPLSGIDDPTEKSSIFNFKYLHPFALDPKRNHKFKKSKQIFK